MEFTDEVPSSPRRVKRKGVLCAWCGENELSGQQRKYCGEACRSAADRQRQKVARREERGTEVLPPQAIERVPDLADVERPCPQCGKGFTGKARFCSKGCQLKADDEENRPDISEGERALIRVGVLEAVLVGSMTQKEAAELAGIAQVTVSRVLKRIRERGRNVAAENVALREDYFPAEGDDIDTMIAKFKAFRERFFTDTKGSPFIVKPFHERWIKSLLEAIETGERTMVLSPPRHGKTSLLAHFMCWLIIWRPNIRIMWVGNNLEIAAEAVGLVKDHLEKNEALILRFSPHGEGFRSRDDWSAGSFTVKTRTVVGIKSPTMVAVGRSGKILSRDCDVIIADDIEDQESTQSPTTRVRTRTWITNTLESRKEDDTAFFVIGSRQHPDDLYGHLLDDPQWDSLVDAAHEEDCNLDPLDEPAHVECMLMPEIRSYKWLMEKRRAADVLGNVDHFDMVYLQIPTAIGLQIFTRELCEPARNVSRGLGVPKLEATPVLIGGLDPAATGYQAAWIWAVDPTTGVEYMVDMDNRRGGGVVEAHRAFMWGLATYGVRHWVVEDNGFQRAIRLDRHVRDWANAEGVFLEGHITHTQKADPMFGVGSMTRLFEQGKIDLPYGTPEARAKTDLYLKQAYNFTDDGSQQRRRKSDVLMASWFPQKPIRRLLREHQAAIDVQYSPMFEAYQQSEWNSAPWS